VTGANVVGEMTGKFDGPEIAGAVVEGVLVPGFPEGESVAGATLGDSVDPPVGSVVPVGTWTGATEGSLLVVRVG
jgi:hypothetical protein